MSVTRHAILAPAVVAAMLGIAAVKLQAQAPANPGGAATVPPVLSTTPDPPAGSVPEAGQMSGLPLQVGDLAPGIVAVRVIRRSFSENVGNQAVELRVGATGRTVKAVTSSDGRAQFEPLAVGETVQVHAAVEGEVLESQPFQLPARGGVRLVLVAGVGAGTPVGQGPAVVVGAEPVSKAASGPPTLFERIGAGPIVMAVLGILAVGVALWPRLRVGRRARAIAAPRVPPPGARADRFESLVQLEKDFAAARVEAVSYQAQRETLLAELVALDLAHRSRLS